LRKTITGHGPIVTTLMWLASGIGLTAVAPVVVTERAVVVARARRFKGYTRYAARTVQRWEGWGPTTSPSWRSAPVHPRYASHRYYRRHYRSLRPAA
jgi:hypothetical protein